MNNPTKIKLIIFCSALLLAGGVTYLTAGQGKSGSPIEGIQQPESHLKKELKRLGNKIEGKVVFHRTPKGREVPHEIAVLEIGSTKTKTIIIDGMKPRWSPDGKHIAFLRGNDIMHARADGKKVQKLTTANVGFALAYHPDGKHVVFTDHKEAKSVNIETKEVNVLLTHDEFKEIDISKDGNMLIATQKKFGGYSVRAYNLSSGDGWVIGNGCSTSFSPDFSKTINNLHGHKELAIRDVKTKKVLQKISAPQDQRFDNQTWSNHPEWIISVNEGRFNEIFVHYLPDNSNYQITRVGNADYPDLHLEL